MFSFSRAGLDRIPLLAELAKHHRKLNTSVGTPRRGGRNLSKRLAVVHPVPVISQLKSINENTLSPFGNADAASLSAPGQAYNDSKEAASRLARESGEYTIVEGIRVPKKPKAPESDGKPSSHFSPAYGLHG